MVLWVGLCIRESRDLMSSSLDSGSKLLGLRLDRINVMCFLAKFFTFTLPLSTQGYKWVLGNCQGSLITAGGGGIVMDQHRILGGIVILLVASW